MHYVIGISGRCQSGKDTLADYVKEFLAQESNRHLVWHRFSKPHTVPRVKIVHFADDLKAMCQKMFKISYEDMMSTEGKHKTTQVQWSSFDPQILTQYNERNGTEYTPDDFLTVRQVLEVFGTDVCRRIDPDCWLNCLESDIKSVERHTIFLVPDVRSANEIEMLKSVFNGKVYRLTRNPEDRKTEIEYQLDKEHYDWSNFDGIIDNEDMDLEEKNQMGLSMILKGLAAHRDVSP